MPKKKYPNILNGADNLRGKVRYPEIKLTITGGRRAGKTLLRAKIAQLLALIGNQVIIDGPDRLCNDMYLDEPMHLFIEPRTITIVDKE